MAEPNGKLRGKIAAVTGAGTGIGSAPAQSVACEGASVALADISFQLTIESLDCSPSSSSERKNDESSL